MYLINSFSFLFNEVKDSFHLAATDDYNIINVKTPRQYSPDSNILKRQQFPEKNDESSQKYPTLQGMHQRYLQKLLSLAHSVRVRVTCNAFEKDKILHTRNKNKKKQKKQKKQQQ